jgi:hypothetical protein
VLGQFSISDVSTPTKEKTVKAQELVGVGWRGIAPMPKSVITLEVDNDQITRE